MPAPTKFPIAHRRKNRRPREIKNGFSDFATAPRAGIERRDEARD
jgi:hypothetical protein